MTEIVNSTDSSPVYRGDGKRMYGLDAEIEEKVIFLMNFSRYF